jgi:hypothetical protein
MKRPFDGTQLCAEIDSEIFFYPDTLAEAIKVCNACPLLKACDNYASNTPGLFGVWGGKYYTLKDSMRNYKSPVSDRWILKMRKELAA